MKWKVFYSGEAEEDLKNIYEYIAYKLLAPETAKKLANGIIEAVASLEEMPKRYPIYDKAPWQEKGLRYFSVKNYLIFYILSEKENTVAIVRIMYGGRDTQNQLNI